MSDTVQTGPLSIIGTRVVRKDYPSTSGLTVGTEKQAGRKPNLKPQKSAVSAKKKVLI